MEKQHRSVGDNADKTNGRKIPASSKFVPYHAYTEKTRYQPPPKVQSNWGPIRKINLPEDESVKAFAEAKREKVPWDHRSEEQINEILQQERDAVEIKSAAIVVEKPVDIKLSPCEKIGRNYSPHIETVLSPRTLGSSKEDENCVSSPRPGRILRVATSASVPERPLSEGKFARGAFKYEDSEATPSIDEQIALQKWENCKFDNLEQLLALDESKFPLDVFDGDEYETMDHEFEKLAIKELETRTNTLRGHSRYFSSARRWVWEPCLIVGYNSETKKYAIRFRTAKTKYVKRLSIRFQGENPELFEKRLEKCRQRKEACKGAIRFYRFIQEWSDRFDEVSPMRLGVLETLLKKSIPVAARSQPGDFLQGYAHMFRDLVSQIKEEYTLAVRHSIIQYYSRHPVFRKNLIENRMTHLSFLERNEDLVKTYYGMVGTIQDGQGYALIEPMLKRVRKNHWTADNTLAGMICRVHRLWLRTFQNCLFVDVTMCAKTTLKYPQCFLTTRSGLLHAYTKSSTSTDGYSNNEARCLSLPSSLENFENLQREHIRNLSRHLTVTWRRLIIDFIHDAIDNVHVLYQRNFEEFHGSKLWHFLAKTNLLMKQQLRDIVARSAYAWVELIETYASGIVDDDQGLVDFFRSRRIQATVEEENGDKLERFNSLIDNPPTVLPLWQQVQDSVQLKKPLFSIKLIVNDDRQIVFNPDENEFCAVFLRALERIEVCVKSVEKLDKDMFPLLFTESEPVLNIGSAWPVTEDTERILEHARRRISEAFQTFIPVAKALAALYKEFSPILQLDVESYVASFVEKSEQLKQDANLDSGVEEDDDEVTEFTKRIRQEELDKRRATYMKDLISMQRREVKRFFEAAKEVERKSHDFETIGLFTVDCTEVKRDISKKAKSIAGALMDSIVVTARQESMAISKMYQDMLQRMNEAPKNEAELISLKEFIANSEDVIKKIEGECQDIQVRIKILEEFSHPMPDPADFGLIWGARLWPRKVRAVARESLTHLSRLKTKMMQVLKKEQKEFEANLSLFEQQAHAFQFYENLDETEQYAEEVGALDERLGEATRKSENFTTRENMFGWFPTEYPQLQKIKTDFEPYNSLWSTVSEFGHKTRQWLSGPFLDLDATIVENKVGVWYQDASYLQNYFDEDKLPAPYKVACYIFDKIKLFKEKVPLIKTLASPALRKRHWMELSELLQEKDFLGEGEFVEPDEEFTLQYLLDLNVESIVEDINQIREVAEKEYHLEKVLDSMMLEWEEGNIQYRISTFADSDMLIVRDTDDIMTMLDDQIAKVQTMCNSSFIKPIETRARDWERKLDYTQRLLDEWLILQKSLIYLCPVFASDDMMQQLPREARRFAVVDQLWKKNMETISQNPSVMDVSDIGLPSANYNSANKEKVGLMYSFKEANETLEMVQRSLNVYLESKRLSFPRFFFLSNDELLQILSQTKDPLAVQPHLSKSFEGIHRICFNGEGEEMNISAMISAEQEQVKFLSPVYPNKPGVAGHVELWMTEVESQMNIAVRFQVEEAIKSYSVYERAEWVMNWPGQAVLCANQVHWTQGVERALQAGQDELQRFYENLGHQLEELICLVRGSLSNQHRQTLSSLVVIDVHDRDVVLSLLNGQVARCEKPVAEFQWQAQMRYYYYTKRIYSGRHKLNKNSLQAASSAPEGSGSYKEEDVVEVRITNSIQDYGNEYLGNSSRLVITPLTDRCYLTLIGAISLLYGGAPAGPAGTGKTETTKDLAKALAMQCVVFNGSDGLDYMAMAKFFKGLAGSGAWACFDEFNRIDIEVLSVVGQQIATIQAAKREGLRTFSFEGTTHLPLRMSCNVFITMNPGYAGRSELPDSLAVLFRPCAMMLPDYALIAEIVLYSYGFSDARNMARKIVQVLRLSSEQLSSQDHYDYGMRAVKTILDTAGKLRRSSPESLESTLTLQAIIKVNLPKFTGQDIPLFKGILRDLFPKEAIHGDDYGVLGTAIDESCKKNGLQGHKVFKRKCMQLYDTILVRHGLMMVGQTMSSKTSIVRTLQDAITTLAKQNSSEFQKVNLFTINPKAVKQTQLYGSFHPNTHEWEDGVLAITVRECSQDSTNDYKWIMFDGPVDAIWIESMNTALDDNKKLCLNSGEIIRISDTIRLMYEVENLKVASPATVSRCGMIYLEQNAIGWRVLVESFLESNLPRCLGSRRFFIQSMFTLLIERVLNIMNHASLKRMLPLCDMELVDSVINLFSSTLDRFHSIDKSIEELEGWKEGAQRELKQAEDDTIATACRKKLIECDNQIKTKLQRVSNPKSVSRFLACNFLWAVVWGIGGLLEDPESRNFFDEYLRSLLNETNVSDESSDEVPASNRGNTVNIDDISQLLSVPTRTDLFGYFPRANTGLKDEWSVSWEMWVDHLPVIEGFDKSASFSSILVPTVDLVRSMDVVSTLASHQKHVLLVGSTGTGKTMSIKRFLQKDLNPNTQCSVMLQFSAHTTENDTQRMIDSKLDRRRKGVFGPPLGKRCLIFVDDLNMPEKEVYGAQPPIELLRQWMDHRGWYDLKTKTFRDTMDLQFVAAMAPPRGGRNSVTPRYIRHYNVVSVMAVNTEALRRIFSTIMNWHFSNVFPELLGSQTGEQDRPSFSQNMVHATIGIYETISVELLPTPAKSHYTFNVRDLSKVFQGISQARASLGQNAGSETTDQSGSTTNWIRLWAHECIRVFEDRLVSGEDKAWFEAILSSKMEQCFSVKWKKIFSSYVNNTRRSSQVFSQSPLGPHGSVKLGETLMFGDFFCGTKKADYEEVISTEDLKQVLVRELKDYNEVSNSPMELVLFDSAIQHISRISRCIKQPAGHALLVGVGGSGRASLTTLATYIAGFQLFLIEPSVTYGIDDWREDLKSLFQLAGFGESGSPSPVVFLLRDTQIMDESFVEDINTMLNVGEVPDLFSSEEMAQIVDQMTSTSHGSKGPIEDDDEQNAMRQFLDQCKRNLRIVLCFSPVNKAFRGRLRNFPSLVNCCYIDWFADWATEALQAVAERYLGDLELTTDVLRSVINVCVDMQNRVAKMTNVFREVEGRHYYVTPTSYLELINMFKLMMKEKRSYVKVQWKRFEVGLKKLLETEKNVGHMQEELKALQPILQKATYETDLLVTSIGVKQKDADATRLIVQQEEEACNLQADAALAIKRDCETQLAEALPFLDNALRALKTLNKNDIVEVRTMKKPPAGVKLTMEAVCIMLGLQPKKIPNPTGKGGKIDDYWEVAQKELLGDPKFLNKLVDFDKDNIPQEIVDKIQPYTRLDAFTPEVVKKASKAAAGLCKWIHAMVVYERVTKDVAPKRAALLKANNDLVEAREALEMKKQSLIEVTEFLEQLVKDYGEANEKKEELRSKVSECKTKLGRATKLISGLAQEKDRWGNRCKDLEIQFGNIVGDILISSGIVAYLGPFTGRYRDECTGKWISLLLEEGIPSSSAENFALATTLGDPVTIREWGINKLPSDSFSIQNAIMLYKSSRWPLMIDPQGQANTWIRAMETNKDSSKLQIVKQDSTNFSRTLENSIELGLPLLIENIGENVHPLLEPLLQKRFFYNGGMKLVQIGSNSVPYNNDFRLYLTTNMANPHFTPEVCVKVNLLNFMATQAGLQEQMLGTVVDHEDSQLEEMRDRLIIENAANQAQLEMMEEKILKLLSSAKGDILEDEQLIDVLSASKQTANQIETKVASAAKMQAKNALSRKAFQPVAVRAAVLYFCVADLNRIDPMYQYSLVWFIDLFLATLRQLDKDESASAANENDASSRRMKLINEAFTKSLYISICRSLFAKDKLLFSFALCTKLMENAGTVNPVDLSYFLKGSTSMNSGKPNPTIKPGAQQGWLRNKSWLDIVGLDALWEGRPSGFSSSFFENNLTAFEAVYQSRDPAQEIQSLLPSLSNIEVLVLLRILRPDKVLIAVRELVASELGPLYSDPPSFVMSEVFQGTTCVTPVIFILSRGANPMGELIQLADKEGFSKRYNSISMGQGQGPIAERAIAEAIDNGTWVVLQNCHLAVSWLSTLERICYGVEPDRTNPDFRLWLTSKPCQYFPVGVLQIGVKVTLEPPRGVRASLLSSITKSINLEELLQETTRPHELCKLLFSLCFFHSVVQERGNYGPLGWNKLYDFNKSDLLISVSQLVILLEEYDTIPFETLRYMVGECNYGGRITEGFDRRTLNSILDGFYHPNVVADEAYTFSPSGIYKPPARGADAKAIIEYVRMLPRVDSPEVFGLHENASISTAEMETTRLCESMNLISSSLTASVSSGTSATFDEHLMGLAREIKNKIPACFDLKATEEKYPTSYSQSMNAVLLQEVTRYNNLLQTTQLSLQTIDDAVKGLIVMSAEVEATGAAMLESIVPPLWLAVCYPTLKPLASWVEDLGERVKFFKDWIRTGIPKRIWAPAFFFHQSFLTGMLQNFARRTALPIDGLDFDFDVVGSVNEDIPENALVVYGFFMEGARWGDASIMELAPKTTFSIMDDICLIPKEASTPRKGADGILYECPVYKTRSRAGTLSTIGHSTNFIMSIYLPSKNDSEHWIKRGVALISQMD